MNMERNLHAFRVRLGSESTSPSNVSDAPTEQFHTRRAHNKSRRGCEYCKQRRRKCDEQKPTCSLCAKTKKECIYARTATSTPASDNQVTRRINASQANTPALRFSGWPGPRSPAVLTSTGIGHTKYDLELIDHFFKKTGFYFNETGMPGIDSPSALELAKEYPYIMHGMIALAACHLQHMGIDGRRYRNSEAFHCQSASRGLRDAVASIKDVKEADAVIATAMLLNCFSFCAPDYREPDPVIIDGRPWTWLRIQVGFAEMLMRIQPFWAESMWGSHLLTRPRWHIDAPPVNGLDVQLAAFCGIDQDSTAENCPYFEFWKRISLLVVHEPSEARLRMYVAAIGSMSPELVRLFETGDTKALMLFVHWSRLMIKVEIWWSARRMKSTCWAACNMLRQKIDRADSHLLEHPAEACGFDLSFRIEEEVDNAETQVLFRATAHQAKTVC
ncbi:hypothetical protein CC80DRAFT_540147 [Byssothecium circinans]|uniref:Zn(2)-C6 fungal-type domain-containing protein n=1 Tax=Byssothecium circinans TaxID=147558 RepID=A0A6A5TKS9_9PLEO|nr:hypothetical protein CC80DRAFT_540147 [Byssothecium circinans]